jgi:hypothetical protein
MGVTKVDTVIGGSVIVAFRSLSSDDDRMGIAQAEGDLVSSAKATLDALNRYVSMNPDRQREEPGGREHVAVSDESERRKESDKQYEYE